MTSPSESPDSAIDRPTTDRPSDLTTTDRPTTDRPTDGAGDLTGPRLDGLLGDTVRALFSDGRERAAPLLQTVVDAAVCTVPGADEAGICLLDGRGTLTTIASSTPVIAEIDRAQSILGEGPVLDALTPRDAPCTLLADLDTDSDLDGARRWRRWVPRVRAAGFAGVLSYPLTGPGFAGALTLYARVADTLGPDAALIGGLFADQAAVAVHGGRRVSGISRALARRELVGRAKGVLGERFGLADAEAFALLAESARRGGCGLREMAERVVDDSDVRATEPPLAPRLSATPRPA